MSYHAPVLLERTIELLAIRPDGWYADLTLGGAGHSRAILERLGAQGRLYCWDRDSDAFANLPDDPRVVAIHANYAHLARWAAYLSIPLWDGVIADLGISSHHVDAGERGFSYRTDASLDMRMNQKATRTAADILATYDRADLARIFSRYGELRNAEAFAAQIVADREQQSIRTTQQLITCAEKVTGRAPSYKLLACLFQALRIEVNQELESLERMLRQLPNRTKKGARVVVLAYHSLEDGLVKNFLRTGTCDGVWVKDLHGNTKPPFRLLTKGVERATDAELRSNTRARSARLRVGERI